MDELIKAYAALLDKYHELVTKTEKLTERVEAAEKLRLPTIEELKAIRQYNDARISEMQTKVRKQGLGR